MGADTSMVKAPIVFRDHVKSDNDVIYSTWMNSLYYGNDWFREIDNDVFFGKYRKVIETILEKKDTKVTIACLDNDADTVVGYAVAEGLEILHWIYVRPAWRKLGIAKSLVQDDTQVTTHITKIGRSIKPKEWVFDPFLI